MPSMDPGYLDPSKQLDSVCFLGRVSALSSGAGSVFNTGELNCLANFRYDIENATPFLLWNFFHLYKLSSINSGNRTLKNLVGWWFCLSCYWFGPIKLSIIWRYESSRETFHLHFWNFCVSCSTGRCYYSDRESRMVTPLLFSCIASIPITESKGWRENRMMRKNLCLSSLLLNLTPSWKHISSPMENTRSS